jgi:hypothetical protein
MSVFGLAPLIDQSAQTGTQFRTDHGAGDGKHHLDRIKPLPLLKQQWGQQIEGDDPHQQPGATAYLLKLGFDSDRHLTTPVQGTSARLDVDRGWSSCPPPINGTWPHKIAKPPPSDCFYRLCRHALMTEFKKREFSDSCLTFAARLRGFVWLTIAIQNLLNCDGLLPSLVNEAYWKL